MPFFHTSPYNEAALLTSLQLGHQKAFEELYDRFAPNFLGILVRIVHHQEQAEDLLQESFIKICSKVKYFDSGKGRLFSWMLHIVRHTAFDYLETQAAKQVYHSIDLISLELAGVVTPSYQTIGLAEWIQSILSIEQRQVVELVYFQGYTQQEIANEFGIPLGTVKTRIRTALHQLKTLESGSYTQVARC